MSRLTGLIVALLLAACGASGEPVTTTPAEVTTTTLPPTSSGLATTVTTTTTTLGPTTTTLGPTTTSQPTEIAFTVTGGSEVERFRVRLDGEIRLTVTAEVTDEVHLHGYDLYGRVAPGAPAVLEFTAAIPGVFEIELEGSGTLIGELQVEP